jgi:glycosyltransferase involved in cell wall biosynthesis
MPGWRHDFVTSYVNNTTVIIPVLNEASSIAKTIQSIREVVPTANIVVIDNGSTDETCRLALAENVVLLHEPQKGKGFAVRRGFASVPNGCTSIVMVDGDDTYGCERLLHCLDLVENFGFDMIVGNRVPDQNSEETRKPVYRRSHAFGNFFFSIEIIKRIINEINSTLIVFRYLNSYFFFTPFFKFKKYNVLFFQILLKKIM